MIQKALLLSLLLLLNSCSLDSLIALGEVDKVQVVKKNASYAQYRAYFTRTQLKPIKNNQKYLYFYNKTKKDLAVLLHRYDNYILYSLYHPEAPHMTFKAKKHTRYTHIQRALKKQGYLLSSPHAVGATSKVGLRKYKGIKTLLIEIKDYRNLQKKYQKAIHSYDARSIVKIKTQLPHVLIDNYFKTYQKKASSEAQRKQLDLIADKLHLHTPESKNNNAQEEEIKVQEALAKEIPEETVAPSAIPENAPFKYYAQEASYHELETYLNDSKTKDSLTFNQYTQLTQRYTALKDKKMLKDGSLEELISSYKTNKNPKYKKRILELMKEAQQ